MDHDDCAQDTDGKEEHRGTVGLSAFLSLFGMTVLSALPICFSVVNNLHQQSGISEERTTHTTENLIIPSKDEELKVVFFKKNVQGSNPGPHTHTCKASALRLRHIRGPFPSF